MREIRKYVVVLLSIFILKPGSDTFAQVIINGSFEFNNGQLGTDYLDLDNLPFDTLIPYCSSYGTASVGGLDLISTNNWDGLAYSGNWYLGIEGGNKEQFSMQLDTPVVEGVMYRISYYDRGRAQHPPAPVEIGISSNDDSFGTVIYSGPAPEVGEWNRRCFTFVAPFDGQYITVRGGSTMSSWTKLDNFIIDKDTLTQCIEISVLTMPNVFTPNNDGVNDIFQPIEFENIFDAQLIIVNRWGNSVFETTNLMDGWNGDTQSAGVYFWCINYQDAHGAPMIGQGFVHLVR